MTTYFADAAYIRDMEPGLVERNSSEFYRMKSMLDDVELELARAKKNVVWESDIRASYDARMNETEQLREGLARGWSQAGSVLLIYAEDLRIAERLVAEGLESRKHLEDLINSSRLRHIIDHRVVGVELWDQLDAMRVWDCVRLMTSVTLVLANIFPDDLASGNRLYAQADAAFYDAVKKEKAVSRYCADALRDAYAALPDFRGGDFSEALRMVRSTPAFAAAVINAIGTPGVQLPGYGPKDDDWPSDTKGSVLDSDKYTELKGLRDSVDIGGLGDDEHKWVKDNKDLFAAAAAESGIPPELLAAIMYKEEPDWNDREKAAFGEGFRLWSSDTVSMGENQIQIRRAAEVLGFDPGTLTFVQRAQIAGVLGDPAMNVLIAAEHLERIKAGTEFADVPYESLSPDELHELAARYQGGDDWNTPEADEYAGDVLGHVEKAKEDLK